MIFKIGHVILLASVKYILTLPYAMVIGLEYKQALFSVLIGGIGGFLFFYYLSRPVLRRLNYVWLYTRRFIPAYIKIRYKAFYAKRFQSGPKKMFTRKNRFLARFRTTYGFWGIIITTPLLLTIPVGAFLANKYYSKRKQTVPFMILSIIGWAAVLSGFVHMFPKIFF
jgi:hypothetical protein